MRFARQVVLGLILLALVAESASAHSLGAACRPKGNQVEVEAYFSDGALAAEAKVRVTDSEGTTVVEGVTDERGRWRFAKPAPGRYRVWVDATGHTTYVDLTPEF